MALIIQPLWRAWILTRHGAVVATLQEADGRHCTAKVLSEGAMNY